MKRLTKDYEKEVNKYPMNDEFIFLPYINLLLVAGKMMCMGPDHVEKLYSVRAVQSCQHLNDIIELILDTYFTNITLCGEKGVL